MSRQNILRSNQTRESSTLALYQRLGPRGGLRSDQLSLRAGVCHEIGLARLRVPRGLCCQATRFLFPGSTAPTASYGRYDSQR